MNLDQVREDGGKDKIEIILICLECRKVLDENAGWSGNDTIAPGDPSVLLSHGLCDDCLQKLYPEYAKKI